MVRYFLRDLASVADILGLTVVGIHPRNGSWYDLSALMNLARTYSTWSTLHQIHLRVYGQEDYLDRIRDFYAKAGQFTEIPGDQPVQGDLLSSDDVKDLNTEISATGISQSELATRLGVDPSHISRLLSGEKNWSKALRTRCRAALDQYESEEDELSDQSS